MWLRLLISFAMQFSNPRIGQAIRQDMNQRLLSDGVGDILKLAIGLRLFLGAGSLRKLASKVVKN